MKFVSTALSGVYIIELVARKDARGAFIKTFHEDTFKEKGLETNFRESYYSISQKGVIRGMHFQTPPHDHAKLVYVSRGSVLDVILDLRKSSPTFGQHISVELSDTNHKAVYLPKGMAHGFASLEDKTTMVYNTSTVYAPSSDGGILWSSFGCQWPFDTPELSERDQEFPTLENFHAPF